LFSKKWIYENVFGLTDHDMITLQKQLVDDSKGLYRFKQIEEDGNDPALSFLKAKEEAGDGSKGEGDKGIESDEPEVGGESSIEKPTDGKEEPGATGIEAPKLTEKKSQKGRKDARKYPFGEDPLGTLELNSNSDLSPRHNYRNKSPLSLESLSQFYASISTTKEVLSEELKNQKSFMDESNIKE